MPRTRFPPRYRRDSGCNRAEDADAVDQRSPHNPTGAVFTAGEIARRSPNWRCRQHRFVAAVRRGSDEILPASSAHQPALASGHGGANDRRLQPVIEIARGARLPLRLGNRAAGAARASLQPAVMHDLRQPRLSAGGRAGGAAARPCRGRGAARGLSAARGDDERAAYGSTGLPGGSRRKAGCLCCSIARGTGLGSEKFALQLLEREHCRGAAFAYGFGPSGAGHLRIALSVPDSRLRRGRANAIVRFAQRLAQRQ